MSCAATSFERPDPYPWYAVRIRANHESVSASILKGKGFDPYLPTYSVVRKWSDRTVAINQPLFPGYLFCRFDAERPLPVLSTSGVVSILGVGKTAVPITEAEIKAVQDILHSGVKAEPFPYLREGTRVRVMRGPLQSLEGIFLKYKNHCRLVVSVSLLQRSMSIEVDRDCVSAA